MDKAQMLQAQRNKSRFWIDLDEPPRRRLQIVQPTPAQSRLWADDPKQSPADARQARIFRLEEVSRILVVGWEGFTEADLLGESQAPSTPQEFSPEVFFEWVRYQLEVQATIAASALKKAEEFEQAKAEARKN